ncbi:hypothetical protein [Mariniflexile sp.]|uniref:hypothetical protein n=1 Tax=Mariniflexile sp. TaxID=1979402 RepID=UPI00356770F0
MNKNNDADGHKKKFVFWTTDARGKLKINQYRLIKFLQKGGFFKTTTKNGKSVVRVTNNIVSEAPDHEMIDYVKKYLKSINEMEVLETFSTGVSNYINRTKLNLLDTVIIPIDKDPKDECWFYYKNTGVKITKSGIELVKYEDLPHKIWESRILDRDYIIAEGDKSDFENFLYNLAGQNDDRFKALKSVIGYLLHRYNHKSITKAIIFLDENMSFDGQAHGGTGKTLITEAIGKMRELVGVDGKNIKAKSLFKNQRIANTTDVIRYDDVQRDFSLETLYSMITSGVSVEKKYQDEFYISPEDAPKIVISSNYPVKGTGGSTDKRRRCEFEIANHYNENHQPIDDFGLHFFDDWNQEQWNYFDTLMMNCAKLYLDKGLIIPEAINLVKNKLVSNTSMEFVDFMKGIELDTWIDKRAFHEDFIKKYPEHSGITSHQLTKWQKEFASQNNLEYHDKSSGGDYSFILKTVEKDEDEK